MAKRAIKTIALNKDDQVVFKKLQDKFGIQSFSDMVRMSLRKLAEAEGLIQRVA